MYIYNIKQHSQSLQQHILDPDYEYNHHIERNIMHDYFKYMNKPTDVSFIVGIYIDYTITHLTYHQHPKLYEKFSSRLQAQLEKYFDFDYTGLFNGNSHYFFLTLFDISEEIILQHTLQFIKQMSQKHFSLFNQDTHIQLKVGIYFSHPYIHPYQFYDSCKKQYENTLLHQTTLLSVKSLSSIDTSIL